MNFRILMASFSLAAGLGMAAAALADTPIYKWIDDQGRVHYSTEPHGDKANKLTVQNQGNDPTQSSTAPAAVSAAAQAAAESQQYQSDAVLVQPQPADSPACKSGRDRLFKYLHADSLYNIDDKGNKVALSAEDKKKALDEARAYVTQACGGGGV